MQLSSMRLLRKGAKVMMGMGMAVTNSKPSPRLKRPSMLNLFRMSHTTSNLSMHGRYLIYI